MALSMCSASRPRLLAAAALLAGLFAGVAWAEPDLRVCQHQAEKYAYRIELSNLLLARTAERYGPRRIQPSSTPDPTQERCLELLRDGQVDLAYVPPTEARLRDFRMLPVDLHKGMLGYRVLLIHQADAVRFARVNSLADLRQLRGGFGSQWGDFALFARNRLPVVGMANPDNLLPMLARRRFDYYHRGLHEAWRELEAQAERYPQLMVEPHLALVYNLPVYFTFKREDEALQRRFAEGLAMIEADGSFRALFLRHFGDLVERARLDQRTLIPIDYPTPAGLPPRDTRLWLNP
ncbi:substrate-binding periplasmic protein [Pseudomonas zhanjiangensis]|uniref:Substrate-binding periplasmic protein n=1 Tax=Pseudomonas zhanjiangensis TaxID=3239015 RepID=A0ABV3YUE4_9PSED